MKEKKIFNTVSEEKYNEAKIINGNPNGIINFNGTNHAWATSLYKKMLARSWFAEQVNVSKDKVNYPLLSAEEKRTYDLILAQLITNDSIQTNQLMDKFNSLVTSPVVNACLSRQAYEECLIEGTEVLTTDGFKDFRNLTTDDYVANYQEDGKIFFSKPSQVVSYPYSGDLIKFTQTNYEQIVTPNHRMVKRFPYYGSRVSEEKKGTIAIEEAEIASLHNYDIPVAGYHEYGNNLVFTALDAIGVAWQADGSLVNNQTTRTHRGYCYHLAFQREDKINRMQLLINIAGIEYTRTVTHRENRVITHFYIWCDRKYDKNFDWVTLIDKHSLWFVNFLSELRFWDGSDRGKVGNKVSILFTNTNMTAISKVQAVAALAGAQTGAYMFGPGYPNNHISSKNKVPACQLYIILGKDHKTGREMKKEVIPYYGNVYCCTVETGMIICRYNKTVFVTGNSQHSMSYSVMAEDICQDTDRLFNLQHHDEELAYKNNEIQNLYMNLYTEGKEITPEDFYIACVANQILEALIFPLGFVALFSMGDKMPGTCEMIAEIAKD